MSRELEELVQMTADSHNAQRDVNRLRTVTFTGYVDERELAGLDTGERVQLVELRWRELYRLVANHVTENLPANQYQLLRVVRGSGNATHNHRLFAMTLTLEVGQVTERPFVNVSVGPEHIHEDYRRGSRVPTESEFLSGNVASSLDREVQRRQEFLRRQMDEAMTQPPQEYVFGLANAEPTGGGGGAATEVSWRVWTGAYATASREQVEATIRAVRNGAPNGGLPEPPFATTATPPTQKPDPVPHKRHILIDKKNPTP